MEVDEGAPTNGDVDQLAAESAQGMKRTRRSSQKADEAATDAVGDDDDEEEVWDDFDLDATEEAAMTIAEGIDSKKGSKSSRRGKRDTTRKRVAANGEVPAAKKPRRVQTDKKAAQQAASIEKEAVVFSSQATDKAPQLNLSRDQLSVTGDGRGYRMVRATHGCSEGSWYWECRISSTTADAEEPHYRLGWAQKGAYLQAPLGFDKLGFAYRDVDGSRYHAAARDDNYGQSFGPGDVVGCLIVLQGGGDDVEEEQDKGGEETTDRSNAQTNYIRFFKNGVDQGIAFSGIPKGTYYPAVSLYKRAQVTANFGPKWEQEPQLNRGRAERLVRPITDLKLLEQEAPPIDGDSLTLPTGAPATLPE